MRALTILALTLVLALPGCGWFRRDAPAPAAEGTANPLIPTRRGAFQRPEPVDLSVPIETVTDLRIEPTLTGAIVYAEGVARRQGAFGVRLVREAGEDGVLALSFRTLYPDYATRVGPEAARQVSVALTVSAQDLRDVSLIRVSAATNARETRRR